MNVQKIWMAVLRRVQTQLEATLVPVTQAIDWQVIDVDVMVRIPNIILYRGKKLPTIAA